MTRKQLDAAASASDEYHVRVGVRRRFNCELRPYVMTCVNIGTAIHDGVVNMTRTFEVPFLVNTIGLEDGEHLFLEVHQLVQKEEKRDWKQAHQQSEADQTNKGADTQGHCQGQGRRLFDVVVTKAQSRTPPSRGAIDGAATVVALRRHSRSRGDGRAQPQSRRCTDTAPVTEISRHMFSRGDAPALRNSARYVVIHVSAVPEQTRLSCTMYSRSIEQQIVWG